jgi:protoporphyrinogen oxidase
MSVTYVPPGARAIRLDDKPTVSVVVASSLDAELLAACLTSLERQCQQHDAEIIVARAALYGELEGLARRHPMVRWVAAEPLADVPRLRGLGLAAARGDIVALADDRAVVGPNWLGQLLEGTRGDVLRGGNPARGPRGDEAGKWVVYFAGHKGGRAQASADAASPPVTPVTPAGAAAQPGVAALRSGDHVVIIGAGPAGLTAAYLLAQDGVAVTVLEGDDEVGGLARTVKYKGYRFDIGGHRFFTKYPSVERLWRDVLGEELIRVPRLSRIYYNGRFYQYPLRAGNALRGLGPWNAAGIALSYLKARLHPSRVEENLEQWVSNRFGRRLYEIFFKTYTEKVWGIPCTEIRAEWAAQRIQGLSLVQAILSAASLNRRSTTIKTLIREFQYPRLGPGQMWELIRDRVEALGGRVLLRHRVKGLEVADGRVVAARVETPQGEVRVSGDQFISTMPIRSLVRALGDIVPPEVGQAAEGLRYRDFLVVALIVGRDGLFPDNWIYVHSPEVKVGRIQNFGNWSAAMVPFPGKSCLGLEYFCFEGDGLWQMPDADLVSLATRELETLGLVEAGLVEEGTVVRMRKAYPIYDGPYRQYLAVARSFLDRLSNLHPVGRNGMHKYNNQDHSMLTAMMTVENLRGAGHDVWAVNTDFEYHEEQRLERHAGAPAGQAAAVAAGD